MDTLLSKYLCRCLPVIDNFSMRWKALLTILIWCVCNKKFNIFSRFPFYYEVKILLLIWLISPVSRGSLGSSILYRRFVHPSLIAREEVWFCILFSIFRGFLKLFLGLLMVSFRVTALWNPASYSHTYYTSLIAWEEVWFCIFFKLLGSSKAFFRVS